MVQKNYEKPYVKVVYFAESDVLSESKLIEGDVFLADIFEN